MGKYQYPAQSSNQKCALAIAVNRISASENTIGTNSSREPLGLVSAWHTVLRIYMQDTAAIDPNSKIFSGISLSFLLTPLSSSPKYTLQRKQYRSKERKWVLHKSFKYAPFLTNLLNKAHSWPFADMIQAAFAMQLISLWMSSPWSAVFWIVILKQP